MADGGVFSLGGAAAANPYSAAAQAFSSAVNSPPPSSAAVLNNKNPLSFNVTGLNLGSILQPYSGSPANGADGYSLESPMGKIKSLGISSNVILYAALGIGGLIAVYFVARR